MATTVINIMADKTTPHVYIGRSGVGYHYGNPFSHKAGTLATVKCKDRKTAIANFRAWIKGENFTDVDPLRRKWIVDNLEVLRGKTLGCFCKPEACHGDVYVELLGEK